MEKLYDTSRSVHDKIVKDMIKPLKKVEINKIIDAGSGKTSASLMLKYFPKAKVDAVVYPGDKRKKNPLENAISSSRLSITEADICSSNIIQKYDMALVHLTLGEALQFGNSFENLFLNIMNLRVKYFLVVDILEDVCVHYRYMEEYWKEKDFKVIKKKKFRNPNPEHYPKVKYDKYKLEFDSKHYVAYLVQRG